MLVRAHAVRSQPSNTWYSRGRDRAHTRSRPRSRDRRVEGTPTFGSAHFPGNPVTRETGAQVKSGDFDLLKRRQELPRLYLQAVRPVSCAIPESAAGLTATPTMGERYVAPDEL